MKAYAKGIFLFHKDLRWDDNTGLLNALQQCEEVLPLFIFDPVQTDPSRNRFFNKNFLDFFKAALIDLQKHIPLQIFLGNTLEVLDMIFEEYAPNAFFCNADYTPFAKTRDAHIEQLCAQKSIFFQSFHDACLTAPGSITKENGTPYVVFTPFSKKCMAQTVPLPQKFPQNVVWSKWSNPQSASLLSDSPSKIPATREHALHLLHSIPEEYQLSRNFPASNKNTFLSSYLKIGLISIREAFWAFVHCHGEQSQGVVELYWRDFFIHIAHWYPHVLEGKCFYEKYNTLPLGFDEQKFMAWKEGKTGFPLVDAGMRELKSTGLMHNRVRMVVASFLIKNLHIDWRKGEEYFAQMLLDYDPAVNNGNWQWSASTGCDAAPYFRIFSPTSQHERFDPESEYVKKWVPELRHYSTAQMINIEKTPLEGYVAPIVDSKKTAQEAKLMYQNR